MPLRNVRAAAGWRFTGPERLWLAVGLGVVLAFGINLEQRTALRRMPMTDLGVFSCAAWAVSHGDNLYTATDWHGWHYQYPPALAILFRPLAHPPPAQVPALAPGVPRTDPDTPWGYSVKGSPRFYGLHAQNARFFCIVAVWYLVSVALLLLSVHLVACALEGNGFAAPPPVDPILRPRWWALRGLPLLVCIGSVGTELSRGQVDVLTLVTVAAALYFVVSNSRFRAGVAFAIPATIKLFPPFLLLYPIWRRQWRMALGMVSGLILLLGLLPLLVLGPARTTQLYRDWITVLAKPALGHGTDTSRAAELTGMSATDNQSLLVFIHNWTYHDLPRHQRPSSPSPTARQLTYLAGALMLVGVGVISRLRRKDSPRELVIIVSLLVGIALVMSPVVHNFYYFLLAPLVAAILDYSVGDCLRRGVRWRMPLAVAVFMAVDILTRLPKIGPFLRDCGVPLLSLIGLMCAGAMILLRHDSTTLIVEGSPPGHSSEPARV